MVGKRGPIALGEFDWALNLAGGGGISSPATTSA